MMKLDRDELALRMLESAVGFHRPPNMSAVEALTYAPKILQGVYQRAAAAACQYFIECAGPMTIIGNASKSDDREGINGRG